MRRIFFLSKMKYCNILERDKFGTREYACGFTDLFIAACGFTDLFIEFYDKLLS